MLQILLGEQTAAEKNMCYWTGVGDKCKKGDETLTFAGTFLEALATPVIDIFKSSLVGQLLEKELDGLKIDLSKRYCCPPDEMKKWKDCS